VAEAVDRYADPYADLYADSYASHPRTSSPPGSAVFPGHAPSGEWSELGKVRFARLMHSGARVLGGPAVRVAFGGDLKPALAATHRDSA
jgi:hypothetical protein